jgi:DNA-binding GntR family transcriptional regulator
MSSLSDPARPLAHESMSQGVYRHLRERLIAGQFSPGERLTLDAVARSLGTSHMPVREAIRRLAAERALEILPNRAARVPQMSRARFQEMLATRTLLEGSAVALAARRMDAAALAEARRLSDAFGAEIRRRKPDIAELIRMNQALHFTIYAGCGNRVLIELIEALWLQVGPVINLDLRSGSRRIAEAPSATHHERLVAALERRDARAARRALGDDLASAAEVILAGDGLAPDA